MSTEEYRRYLKERLAKLQDGIAVARRRLDEGQPRDKVEAAGRLADLERRFARMSEKLDALEQESDSALEDARTWFDEQATLAEKQINEWMAEH